MGIPVAMGHLRHSLVLVVLLLLSSACQAPLTLAEQQGTAVAGGCWPDGYLPPAPTRTPYARAGAGTPSPIPAPTATPYPVCTPGPRTPTRTPAPTASPTPIPPRTPAAAVAVGGPVEIGNQAGGVGAQTLAIHPTRHTAAVAWIANGRTYNDSLDGQVWVRVQQPTGGWSPMQSVNVGQIGKAGAAGLGLAIAADGTVSAVFGTGMAGDTRLQIVESHDDGMTWSLPVAVAGIAAASAPAATPPPTATPPLGVPVVTAAPAAASPEPDREGDAAQALPGDAQAGAVVALAADAAGGLHLLYRSSRTGGKRIAYAYRAPQAAAWRTSEGFTGALQRRGALGLLPLPGGGVRRYVAIQTDDGIALSRSDDGVAWSASAPVPTNAFLAPEVIATLTMVVAPRRDGLIALAWGQYARGGVYAAVSRDGGRSWTQEERIAQHNADGNAFEDRETGSTRSGFDPWVVYEPASDQLVASWTELDRAASPAAKTTVFAVRPLADAQAPLWRYGVSPATADHERPPTLGRSGWSSRLYGTPDGQAHWLLAVNVTDRQSRVYVQRIDLPGLIVNGTS